MLFFAGVGVTNSESTFCELQDWANKEVYWMEVNFLTGGEGNYN